MLLAAKVSSGSQLEHHSSTCDNWSLFHGCTYP